MGASKVRGLRISLGVLLPALIAAGCNDGRGGSRGVRPQPKPPGPPTWALPGGTGGTAAMGATGQLGLRAVGLSDSVFSPSAPGSRGETYVLVNDSSLAQPRLFIDRGTGLVDSGAVPLQGAPLGFRVQAPRGARLEVRGLKSGSPIASNQVVVGATPAGRVISVSTPAGSLNELNPAPSPRANEIVWSSSGAPPSSYMVVLWSVRLSPGPTATTATRNVATMVEVLGTTTRHTLGDPWARSFGVTGGDTRTPGVWGHAVYALDTSGWVTTASDVQYVRVQ